MIEKFGVYVIRDNGADDSSLPFFCRSTPVAVRQFSNTLRTLPPSARPDFELLVIGSYDSSNFELTDNGAEVSICKGSDEAIIALIEQDRKFYDRVSVDQLPVGEKED